MGDNEEMVDVLDDAQLVPLMIQAKIIEEKSSRKDRRAALARTRSKLRSRVLWPMSELLEKLGIKR